ncbi:MAG: hypothetical protein M3177_04290 [Pseudomonadota bacterium]|nr:hypothetical protein [Pseudomonadota bacterium]
MNCEETDQAGRRRDHGVSRPRLIALRALYAFVAVGLAAFLWPAFLAQLPAPAHYHGVTMAMLAAFSILCAVGIGYPLQMLPVLLWELLWKILWLMLIALPRWIAGTLDAATTQTAVECVSIVLLLLVVPWGYVWRRYIKAPAQQCADRTAS